MNNRICPNTGSDVQWDRNPTHSPIWQKGDYDLIKGILIESIVYGMKRKMVTRKSKKNYKFFKMAAASFE